MENLEPIIKTLNKFILKKDNNNDTSEEGMARPFENFSQENQIELKFVRLNGLSNCIYLVKILDNISNELKYELIYRQFGSIGELVDRRSEKEIINYLSNLNLTPKILETDDFSYRIEEYISNSDTLPRDILAENSLMEKLIPLLVNYTSITSACRFEIIQKENKENKEDFNCEISFDKNLYKIPKQNIFEKCLKMMYDKSKKNYDIFLEKLSEAKINSNTNIPLKNLIENSKEKLDKFIFYMENYKQIFTKIFPKKGILTLNHNDVHSLNLLLVENSEKLYVIDHEYACLNLVGIDIINYLIEMQFDYTKKSFPFYEFNSAKICEKFDKNFEIYLNYVKEYEKLHKEKEGFEILEEKEKVYYFRLIGVISLFWFIYSVMYIDFEEFVKQESFDLLYHANDRIDNFEYALKEIEKFEKEKN